MNEQASASSRKLECPSSGDSVLPPDGKIISVSEWRRQILWIPVVFYSFLGIYSVGYAIDHGSVPAVVLGVVGFGAVVGFSIQTAFRGIALSARGVKARGWWTYRWSWGEIDRFELRERGKKPRLVIHLRTGKRRGFGGFFGRSQEEEDRAQLMFQALQERLRQEHAKIDQARPRG